MARLFDFNFEFLLFALFCPFKCLQRNFATIWRNSTTNYTFDVTSLSTICVQCKQKQNQMQLSTEHQDHDTPVIGRCIASIDVVDKHKLRV